MTSQYFLSFTYIQLVFVCRMFHYFVPISPKEELYWLNREGFDAAVVYVCNAFSYILGFCLDFSL